MKSSNLLLIAKCKSSGCRVYTNEFNRRPSISAPIGKRHFKRNNKKKYRKKASQNGREQDEGVYASIKSGKVIEPARSSLERIAYADIKKRI